MSDRPADLEQLRQLYDSLRASPGWRLRYHRLCWERFGGKASIEQRIAVAQEVAGGRYLGNVGAQYERSLAAGWCEGLGVSVGEALADATAGGTLPSQS